MTQARYGGTASVGKAYDDPYAPPAPSRVNLANATLGAGALAGARGGQQIVGAARLPRTAPAKAAAAWDKVGMAQRGVDRANATVADRTATRAAKPLGTRWTNDNRVSMANRQVVSATERLDHATIAHSAASRAASDIGPTAAAMRRGGGRLLGVGAGLGAAGAILAHARNKRAS